MDLNQLKKYYDQANEAVNQWWLSYQPIYESNHAKMIKAFQEFKVTQECFSGSTGYGYSDYGRDLLDNIFAHVFEAEDALVRTQLVSGTHTLAVCLFGLLRPSERLVSFCGTPYDTLLEVIGLTGNQKGSLMEFGIHYSELPENLPLQEKVEQLPKDTKVVLIQRSRGYAWRASYSINQIQDMCRAIRLKRPDVTIMVDNCYGEFTEEREPLAAGADIIAGSLIKNPGGGLAPIGGYIAGRKDLIQDVSYRLTSPGIGREVGAVDGSTNRMLYQGFYLAPHTVGEALKSAVYTASIFSQLGYDVSPGLQDVRSGIVQAVRFNKEDELIDFCQAIQKNSPIDSHVVPLPWDMPGYDDAVIMAAGTFISGATSELSADAPIRTPYTLYVQGGLSFEYSRLAINEAVRMIVSNRNS
ncbi:methionine gamma-lyase family protein [Clostridia bacterium]|nr:methionine gamma-lyase family protein [Clostridia bacterium]